MGFVEFDVKEHESRFWPSILACIDFLHCFVYEYLMVFFFAQSFWSYLPRDWNVRIRKITWFCCEESVVYIDLGRGL